MSITYDEMLEENQKMVICIGTEEEQEVWFTNCRINRETVPSEKYVYDIRGEDEEDFCTIEPYVVVNHTGSIVANHPIKMNDDGYYNLEENSDGWSFV